VEQAFIGLGTNLGARETNLAAAQKHLAGEPGIKVCGVSSIFETEPWGVQNQPGFLNQAVRIHTDLEPRELLAACKNIEQRMGRQDACRWGPRLIDLDILLYGTRVVLTKDLVIPHAHIMERRFELEPLAELCPGLVIPGTTMTAQQALKQCTDTGEVFRRAEQAAEQV